MVYTLHVSVKTALGSSTPVCDPKAHDEDAVTYTAVTLLQN